MSVLLGLDESFDSSLNSVMTNKDLTYIVHKEKG